MPDYYHALDAPESVIVESNVGGYPVRVPKFLAAHQTDKSSWERDRFQHMEHYLRPGMTLFDVGSEQGYMSSIYARFVGGGENMCLFEPVPESWVNIKRIWEANGLANPKGMWCGFVGEENRIVDWEFPTLYREDRWPEYAYGNQLLEATKFRYEHEHAHCTDSTTIDDWVRLTGIIPQAITIDVEGYEPLVVAGAVETIAIHRPLIWLSIHYPYQNNILYKFTGSDRVEEMKQTLADLEYGYELIAEDHERHTFWNPRS